MKDHKTNEHKGILNFSYISFDTAYGLAENLLKFGGVGTMKDICNLFGLKYKTGWLGLQIKSLRVWGLIEGKGKMHLTERFYKIQNSQNENEKKLIKANAFLEIPLFKEIFYRYSETGLPSKSKLLEVLISDYDINPRYSSPVANSIIDSISNYFENYGKGNNHSRQIVANENEATLPNEKIEEIKKSINIKITSSMGNLDLEATNKEEFEKILNIINALWDENNVQNYRQKAGDTRHPDERRSPAE